MKGLPIGKVDGEQIVLIDSAVLGLQRHKIFFLIGIGKGKVLEGVQHSGLPNGGKQCIQRAILIRPRKNADHIDCLGGWVHKLPHPVHVLEGAVDLKTNAILLIEDKGLRANLGNGGLFHTAVPLPGQGHPNAPAR